MSSMLSMPVSLRHSIFSFLLLPMRSCNVPASVKLSVMVSGFSVSVVAALHTVQLSSRHVKSNASHLLEDVESFFIGIIRKSTMFCCVIEKPICRVCGRRRQDVQKYRF